MQCWADDLRQAGPLAGASLGSHDWLSPPPVGSTTCLDRDNGATSSPTPNVFDISHVGHDVSKLCRKNTDILYTTRKTCCRTGIFVVLADTSLFSLSFLHT